MKLLNQVIIQLYEANRFARSRNPHYRRLAVVLLDNLVELQLSRKAEFELIYDRTTWYSGVRKHNRKTRQSISRRHPELLAFAEAQGWITSDDVRLIGFAHRVRNSFYHKGRYDDADAEIAIVLLYRFIERYLPLWRNSQFGVMVSPHDAIRVEEAIDDATGFCPIDFDFDDANDEDVLAYSSQYSDGEHWQKVVSEVLNYRGDHPAPVLIQQQLLALLDSIEDSLTFVKGDGKGIDFYDVMTWRFAVFSGIFTAFMMDGRQLHKPEVALHFYLASLDEEERLLDIADPREREKAFHELLDSRPFNPKPISRQRLSAVRREAKKMSKLGEGEAIEKFLKIEEELDPLARALKNLASDLDGHIQHLIDVARGK